MEPAHFPQNRLTEPDFLKAIYQETLKELARTPKGLGEFGEYVFGHVPARHHKIWVRLLEEETFRRTIIIAPPGHAKSTWCSVIYPAWRIGLDSTLHYLGTSITATQSQLFSVAIRDTISNSAKYREVFPNIDPDRSKGWGESEWFVGRPNVSDPHPTYAASGVGGPVIGRRAGEIGLDDPYDEKNSATSLQRSKVLTWLKRTLRSRLVPGGRFRAVLTRWHYDDFVKEFETLGTYTIARMLAISPGSEVFAEIFFRELDREKAEEVFPDNLVWVDKDQGKANIFIHDDGPALWPEYWSYEALEQERKDVGVPLFKCMWQGDPSALAGNVFTIDCFRDYPERPFNFKVVKQFWDTALSQSTSASYTVCATGGITIDGDFVLLKIRRGRFSSLKHRQLVVKAWEEDKRLWPELNEVGIEKTLLSYNLLAELKTGEEDLKVTGVPPVGDKVLRARPVAAKGEEGKFYVDKSAAWWKDFRDEFLAFNRGAYDDQVDAVSGLYELLVGSKPRWKNMEFLSI